MQFALPPRKTSRPPIYSRSSPTALRRRQLKSCAVISCIVVSILFLVFHLFSSGTPSVDTPVADGPPVVIVTVLDTELFSDTYIQRIKQNREDYAKRHGYINFFANTADYVPVMNLPSGTVVPRSWALVPAMRHAMTKYPGSTYFFHLSPHSVIMDPSISLVSHVLEKSKLESLMIKDAPVVPPDSVIKTFTHLSGKDVDLVITQDAENLCPGSFIIKRGQWANYFLDAWFDPLYRSYNFAKAENHALDHIVQWHPTILARLALIPQKMINAYSHEAPKPGANGLYTEGDFIVRLGGCESTPSRSCEREMEPYWSKWAKANAHV
ncbi:putative alpha-1,6-mannosyltransferase mnn11 [Microsporum canis]|uniref:Mannosyltransferase complex component n=1 Tax=Arthroderma otae (strain ATCC MYA-4605 / CBS 113480) TaxID=554155 RepID=C5FUM2_ARTOC|nr:mannosyltransferase complex component [Microsporum canis CBS 113480]EEQ33606.1 mannosyltransferase complex component [Microsporum canis CBS 113480]